MNTKLKEEMTSLRAMLAAQAKQGAATKEHERALAVKQKEIDDLEKRVAALEKELMEAKSVVQKLESDIGNQRTMSAQDKETIAQMKKRGFDPKLGRRPPVMESGPPPEGAPAGSVSPEVLAEHRSHVARLEEELEGERRFRREADGEIIKLRAAINGVKLDDTMVRDLLAPSPSASGFTSEENSVAGDETPAKLRYVLLFVSERFLWQILRWSTVFRSFRCVSSGTLQSSLLLLSSSCCSGSSLYITVFR
jgi:hypothetical protein